MRAAIPIKKRRYLTAGQSCAYCGNTVALQVDHIEAVGNGGSNDLVNLQVLCSRCNQWKSDRPESVLISILVAEIKRLKAERIGAPPSFESLAIERSNKF